MGLNDDFQLENEDKTSVPEHVAGEKLPAEMVDVVQEIMPEVIQIEEGDAKIDDIYAAMESIQATGGMTQRLAQECEAVMPGFINEDRPLGYFTKTPSMTQYRQAIEEMSGGIIALIVAGIAALGALIYKFYKWFKGSSGGEGDGGGGADSFGGGNYQTEEVAQKADQSAGEIKDALEKVDHEVRAYNIDTKKIAHEIQSSEPEGALHKIMNGLPPVMTSILEQDEFYRMVRACIDNCKRWEDGYKTAVELIYNAINEYNTCLDGLVKMNPNADVGADQHNRLIGIGPDGQASLGTKLYNDQIEQKLRATKMGRFIAQFDDNNPNREEYKEKMAFFFGSNYKIMIGGKEMYISDAGPMIYDRYNELKNAEPKKYTDFNEVITKIGRLDRAGIVRDFLKLSGRHSEDMAEHIKKTLSKISESLKTYDHDEDMGTIMAFPQEKRDKDGNVERSRRKGSIFSDRDTRNITAGINAERVRVLRNIVRELSTSFHGYTQVMTVVKFMHQDGIGKLDALVKSALKDLEKGVAEALEVEMKKKSTSDVDSEELKGIGGRIKKIFGGLFEG